MMFNLEEQEEESEGENDIDENHIFDSMFEINNELFCCCQETTKSRERI